MPPSFPGRLVDVARRALRRGAWKLVGQDEILRASGLFDTQFYAAQSGLAPDRDRCIRHYLQTGAASGWCPNRLFDSRAYLETHPDVAAAGMDPFVHFVAFGVAEGRTNRVPDSYLTQVSSISPEELTSRRITEQARAAGWSETGPSAWAKDVVAVYASSLGNFFFRHIADRIAEGLRASGVTVYRLDQNSSRPPEVTVHFFVAPHEFFLLGSGSQWRDVLEGGRSVMLNTEQPGTSWYFLALRYAGSSTTLIDMSPQSAVLLDQLGWHRSGYFPVGLLPRSVRSSERGAPDVATVRGLEVLASHQLKGATGSVTEWRARPIDILFLGTLTSRRSKALARLAPALARYRCFIHAPTGNGVPLTGQNGAIGTEASLHLARNAKVIVNIHRGEFSYFEWHRVMMMGIEQGAIVVSEPSYPSPGVEPGRHFLTCPVGDMPEVLHRLLGSSEGASLATQFETARLTELRQRFDLPAELGALAFLHVNGFGPHA